MKKTVISLEPPIIPDTGDIEIIPLEDPQDYIRTAKKNGAEPFKGEVVLGKDADEVIVVIVSAMVYRVKR
jgi:hypothetical protein